MQRTVLKPKVDTSNIFFLSSSGRNSEIVLQEVNFPNSTLSLHRFIDSGPVGQAIHFSFFLHTYSIPCKSLCCKYMPLYTYHLYTLCTHLSIPLHTYQNCILQYSLYEIPHYLTVCACSTASSDARLYRSGILCHDVPISVYNKRAVQLTWHCVVQWHDESRALS